MGQRQPSAATGVSSKNQDANGNCIHGTSADALSNPTEVPGLKELNAWESDEPEDGEGRVEGEVNKAAAVVASTPFVSRLNAVLKKYVSFTSNTLHADQGLKLLQWSFWLVSRLTKDNPNRELSPALRKLYLNLSLVRYTLRLYGFPEAIEAIRNNSWGKGAAFKNPQIDKTGQVMAWSMAFYYPFEHAALARWVAPTIVSIDAQRASAISCRFWLGYIVADLVQSWSKLQELVSRKKVLEDGTAIDDKEREEIQTLSGSIKKNRLQIVRCMLFTLPAVNWSLPNWERDPWLKEGWVNGLMFAESIICLYQSLCGLK